MVQGQIALSMLLIYYSQPNHFMNCDITPSRDNRCETMDAIKGIEMIANNQEMSCEKRAAAIFKLFEAYLKPGDDSRRFRSVFQDPKWILESRIQRLNMISGWIPIEWGRNTFLLELFPNNKNRRRWFIVFRLSGIDKSYYNGGSGLEYAIHFLKGRYAKTVRIVDFALCEYKDDDLFPRITRSKNHAGE